MASLPQSHEGNLRNENRVYSCLREILPTTDEESRLGPYFTFHNEEWQCWVYLNNYSLSVTVLNSSAFSDRFNVRVGILGETGENIVTKNSTPASKCQFEADDIILKSQLDWILKSDERFIFFVEVEKKDEEEYEERKKRKTKTKQKPKKQKFVRENSKQITKNCCLAAKRVM